MNQRTVFILCSFSFILLLITSCSSVSFVANEKSSFKVKAEQRGQEEVTISGVKEFYLWGNSPGFWDIDLQEEGYKKGLSLPAIVSIEQGIEWENVFYSILTLGLYCPTDYKLIFSSTKLTDKENDQENGRENNQVIIR
jgi:hypothetical protein